MEARAGSVVEVRLGGAVAGAGTPAPQPESIGKIRIRAVVGSLNRMARRFDDAKGRTLSTTRPTRSSNVPLRFLSRFYGPNASADGKDESGPMLSCRNTLLVLAA